MAHDPDLQLFLNGVFDRARQAAELTGHLQVCPALRDARIREETADARDLGLMPSELSAALRVRDLIHHFVELGLVDAVTENRARDPEAVARLRRPSSQQTPPPKRRRN